MVKHQQANADRQQQLPVTRLQSVERLSIVTTPYDRGAVVKLTASDGSPAVAKFTIQKRKGSFEVLTQGTDERGQPCMRVVKITTNCREALDFAERECERIRGEVGGGSARADS